MNVKSILAMALLSCSIAMQAQEVKPSSKFGMELQQHLASKVSLGKNANNAKALTSSESPKVKVLVSLVPTSGVTAADLEAVGCEVKFAMKSVASVVIAEDKLEALAAIDNANIIAADTKVLTDDALIEAMKKICDYAEEVKKPIAINMKIK